MATLDASDVLAFADASQWESWLAAHRGRSTGAWLKIAKKGSGRRSVTIGEALDVALCHGWIDSQRRTCDEHYYLQRYSPRRPSSTWSQVNVDRAEALIAAGRMREPGLAAIRAARADGRWKAAYQPQREVTVPDDLAAALGRDERVRDTFDRLGRTERYALLLRLMKARTPGGRAVQLRRIVASLSPPPAGAGRGPAGGAQPDQGPTPPMLSGVMRST